MQFAGFRRFFLGVMNPATPNQRKPTRRLTPPGRLAEKNDLPESIEEDAGLDEEEIEDGSEDSPFSFKKALLLVCLLHLVLGWMVFSDGGIFGKPSPPPNRKTAKTAPSQNSPAGEKEDPRFAGIEEDERLVNEAAEQEATAESPASSIAAGDSYIVQPGDTLGAIAKKTGVSVKEISEKNRIANRDAIRVGQKLAIGKNIQQSSPVVAQSAQNEKSSRDAAGGTVTLPKQEAKPVAKQPTKKEVELRQLWAQAEKTGPAPQPSAEEGIVEEVREILPIQSQVQLAKPILKAEAVETSSPNGAEEAGQWQTAGTTDAKKTGEKKANTANDRPASYVLSRGDNLYSVARRFNVSYDELRSANGITDPRDLVAGYVLNIP